MLPASHSSFMVISATVAPLSRHCKLAADNVLHSIEVHSHLPSCYMSFHIDAAALVSINEVNLHRARLVLGWVTVSGFSSRCQTFISVCNQPARSTQPGHFFVGRRNEYHPQDREPCGWRVNVGMVRMWVAGKTVIRLLHTVP